jgi:H+/Cl- antiporter ClcA
MIAKIYKAGKSMLSLSRWRTRLIFWFGAIVVGITAAGYAFIADFTQKLFTGFVEYNTYLPLIFSPLVFALGAWLTAHYCPGAVGSGIPQAIAARNLHHPDERQYLLGAQNIAGKILFTALGLLGGASIGREGPTVQIGAAILYLGAKIGKVSEEMTRSLILAGAAAGVAAAFNTPLAGIVFAIEEMAREFEHRYSGVVLTAIVLAGASSLSLLGNYTYFGIADGDFSVGRDWFAILIVGAVGGLFGGLFARILIDGGPRLFAVLMSRKLHHTALIAGLCGLIIAALGIATHGATYGSGYEQAKAFLHGDSTGSWAYTVSKFLATIVSGLSGLPGGIFSPSLSVGAGFGASMAPWFSATLPVPLIAASVIAVAVSRLVCPVSLYHALAKTFIAKAKRPEPEPEPAPDPKEVVDDVSKVQ